MDNLMLWQAVLSELELDTSRGNFTAWLKPTTLVSIKDVDKTRQIVTIGCRSPYQQTMVETRYYGQIKQALDRITEKQNELVFSIEAMPATTDKPAGPLFEQETEKAAKSDLAYLEAVEKVRLRTDYIFETFAVSSTNDMAHAAASAVARNSGKAYHLLFLYGGVGVGKTHLMSAVGHEILKVDPDTDMLLCSGEEFMNELVAAIQSKKTSAFKAKYRKIKVLLVDDIQFIAGKDAVQEEFFHTFNAIVQNQGQIILTSDRSPEQMILLEDRLRSRFEGGLTIDIQEPNFELRTAILNIKAKARGIKLPLDVSRLIAGEIKSTRALEGFLAKILTKINARQEEITPETVKPLLGLEDEQKQTKITKYIPPQEILEKVAEYYTLKPSAIKGKRRTKDVVLARHVAMYILRVDLEVPLTEVGRVFGGRDHTTVMHAVEKLRKQMPESERLRHDLESIKKKALGGK